jgi:hypothetical protein
MEPMMGSGPPGYLPPPAGGPDDHSYSLGGGGGANPLARHLAGQPARLPIGTLAIAAALRFNHNLSYSVPAISYGDYRLGLDLDVAPILGKYDGFSVGFRLDLTPERHQMVEANERAVRQLNELLPRRKEALEQPRSVAEAQLKLLDAEARGYTKGANEAYNANVRAWRTGLFGHYREFPGISYRVMTGGVSLSRLYPTNPARLKDNKGNSAAWGVQFVGQGHHASLPGRNHGAASGGVRLTWQDATPSLQTTTAGPTLYRWRWQTGIEYVSSNIIQGGDTVLGFVRYRNEPWRRPFVVSGSNYKDLYDGYQEYSLSVGKGPDDRVFVGVRFAYIFGLK